MNECSTQTQDHECLLLTPKRWSKFYFQWYKLQWSCRTNNILEQRINILWIILCLLSNNCIFHRYKGALKHQIPQIQPSLPFHYNTNTAFVAEWLSIVYLDIIKENNHAY